MKRITAVILALCLAFSLGVNAFAVNIAPILNRKLIRQGEEVTVTIELDEAVQDVKFLETRVYYNPNLFAYPTTATQGGDSEGAQKIVLGAKAITEAGETYATLNYIDPSSEGKDFAEGAIYALKFTALKPFLADNTEASFGFKVADNATKASSAGIAYNGGQTADAKISVVQAGEEKLTLEASSTTAVKDSTVTLNLGFDNNMGSKSVEALLAFDKTVFELDKESIVNSEKFDALTVTETDDGVKLKWESATAIYDPTVALGSVTLKVKKDTAATASAINFTCVSSTNAAGAAQTVKPADEENFSISNLKVGDIDGDGKVNARDAGKVYSHVYRRALLTGEELKRADIDGDGKVNARDAGKLYSYVYRRIDSLP